MANKGILLESGTNELEILEFYLGEQSFGVNVLKIQAIEQYDNDRVTRIRLSHPSIVGTFLFRDECITLIDLRREMEADITEAHADNGDEGPEPELVLVMEFNNLKTAFLVDGVDRIHRASWESIKSLSAFLNTPDSKFTGSFKMDEREILIVDMEKIVSDILPGWQERFAIPQEEAGHNQNARATRKIFLAEDSALIRERVRSELARCNYANLRTFNDGKECQDEIKRLQKLALSEGGHITDYVDLLISDIEMPALDGLALCRYIKSDPNLRDLPVIMFSSLINEQIACKCDDVEADAHIAKPQFAELLELLDKLTNVHDAVPA